MSALLLRFTDEKYVDTYKQGKLSFSALSSFWDIAKNKIPYGHTPTMEEMKKVANDKQQDFSEGIGIDISKDIFIGNLDFYNYICNDVVRARIDSYGYCKILCFYRVDSDNVYIQQIPQEMYQFGNRVVIVKNEKELAKRIINAIAKHGEYCVVGDVQYRNMAFYNKQILNNLIPHHITVVSKNPIIDLSIAKKYAISKSYGCLDKYVKFKKQREFRACWLPRKHNHQREILDIGPADGLFDIIKADELNVYLLENYPGHAFNYVNPRNPIMDGNVTYNTFKKRVEKISGLCSLILELN